jgi:hypothetical protein
MSALQNTGLNRMAQALISGYHRELAASLAQNWKQLKS